MIGSHAHTVVELGRYAHALAGLGPDLLRRHPLRRLGRRRRRRGSLGSLGRTALLGRWSFRSLLGQKLSSSLAGDRFDIVAATKRGVDLAVGDVGPETAFLDDHAPPGGAAWVGHRWPGLHRE